ncbi:MAG: hypothetical protein WC346_04340 [Methanogenium sp.]|jgi:hypothetical protein
MPKVFNRPIKIGGHVREVNDVEMTVLEYDGDSKILLASGTTVPTADSSGFAKGCLFIKTDAADGTKGLYENQGTTTASDFNLVGDISSAELSFTDTQFIKDGSSNEILMFGVVASAENYIKISNAADGNGPTILATGDDTNVDMNLSTKGTGAVTITKATATENEKALVVDVTPSDLTHGVRQGAVNITLDRTSGYALTGWDGNPDCAMKVYAVNRANSSTNGGTRALDIVARNRDSGGESWINTIYATAEHSTGANNIANSTVAELHMKNNAVITSDQIGLLVQDDSQGTTSGDVYGIKIHTANYNPGGGRTAAIYINSQNTGGWTSGLLLDGVITNALKFADSDGTNGATLKAGSYSTGGNEVKLAIDVAGTTYYVIGYATAS